MQINTWKKALALYILLYISSKILFYFLKLSSTGYNRLHVFRLAQIIDISFFMLLGTIFVWARLHALFFDHNFNADLKKNGQITLNDIRLQRRKLIIFYSMYLSFAFCVHIAHFLYYFMNSVEPSIFSYLCLTCVGVWTHLVVFLFGFSILNFILRLLQAFHFGREILKPIFRLNFLKSILTDAKCQTTTALILTAFFSVILIYGANDIRIRSIDIRVKNLPDQYQGFKIALITDIHAGPTVGRSAIRRVVNMTNELSPDIVAIVGDLVDGSLVELAEAVEPLKDLRSKFGVYFTSGNHEFYYGNIDDWFTYLEKEIGIHVLLNGNSKIYAKKDQEPYLCLAGTDDIYSNYVGLEGHHFDLNKALNSCDSTYPTILLTHNPKGAKLAVESDKKIDLILSGHVHAGQMYVVAPIMYILSPYFYGLYSNVGPTGTQIYVSSGTFYWGAPMKMPGFAEITLIRLKR